MESFEFLYNTFFKRVYAYVLLRERNAAEAEDVCACVWRKAYEKRALFDPKKGEFSQWIFAVARNEVNMHWRWSRLKGFFSLADAQETLPFKELGPAREAEEEELKRRLLKALQKLSSRERDLTALKFYSGLNNRQIAQVTGLSESNVGTLLYRAVRKMRGDMEDL